MRGKYAKKRLTTVVDQPGSKRICKACGHTGEEHAGRPNTPPIWCTRSLHEKPSCVACAQVMEEIYKKRMPPMAIMVSQADRDWFKEVHAAYLQRQYDAMHIRRN